MRKDNSLPPKPHTGSVKRPGTGAIPSSVSGLPLNLCVPPAMVAKGRWWEKPLGLVDGCTPVYIDDETPSECEFCWSGACAHMRKSNPNKKMAERYRDLTTDGVFNGTIKLHPELFDLPPTVKKPTVWAVWNDLFHEEVPFKFISRFFGMAIDTPWHIYIVLTKRPERILDFFLHSKVRDALPQNIIMGTSAGTQKAYDIRARQLILNWPGKRVISLAPLFEPIKLTNPAGPPDFEWDDPGCAVTQYIPFDWVIIEAESRGSGLGRSCVLEWVEKIALQCHSAGVSVFVKQIHKNGKLVKAPWPEVLQFPWDTEGDDEFEENLY